MNDKNDPESSQKLPQHGFAHFTTKVLFVEKSLTFSQMACYGLATIFACNLENPGNLQIFLFYVVSAVCGELCNFFGKIFYKNLWGNPE